MTTLETLLQFFKMACEENWPSEDYWNEGGEGFRLAQELDWFDDGSEEPPYDPPNNDD